MDFGSFVLAAATADLDDEPAARGTADAVEYRMDLAAAAGRDPEARLAAYDGELPLIATNRAAAEGGEADGPERERLERLATAAAHDAVAAVDVELGTLADDGPGVESVRSAAAAGEAAIIASTHDFEDTPDAGTCRDLLDLAATHGDVGKLATTAAGPGDVLALLQATHDATADGQRVATMAMGEAGRHSRAVAPLYGSRIGYAPVDPANATAPGQYDLAALDDLIGALGGPRG
jgi:3-dehydroquinate dehydratase-1